MIKIKKAIQKYLKIENNFTESHFIINEIKGGYSISLNIPVTKEIKIISLNRLNKNMDNSLKGRSKSVIKEQGLVGLNNLGATCFMNAALQVFSNIKKFGEYFYTEEYLNENIEKCPISKAFTEVIQNLWDPRNTSYSPYNFKKTIGYYNSDFLKNEPNDSRELIQYLLDALHNELNTKKDLVYDEIDNSKMTDLKGKYLYEKNSFNHENESIISRLFYGIQGTETKCSECKKSTYFFDHFSIISLPILENKNKIIDIKKMFEDYEKPILMEGDNKNYCIICKGEYNATCQTFLYDTPEILIIHPARTNTGHNYSIQIELNETINITPYIRNGVNSKGVVFYYNLIGVISHYGTSGYGGHNIAYCKKNSGWYEFNDSQYKKVIYKLFKKEGLSLIFFYKKALP